MIQVNLYTKQKQTHSLEEKHDCQGEGWGRGIVRALGWTYIHILFKWIINKDLLYSTNLLNIMAAWEEFGKKMDTCIYGRVCCPWKLSQYC